MEETEQSSSFMIAPDEQSKDELLEIITKIRNSHPELELYVSCGCNDKNFCGTKCECATIKEDIRTLFSLGEFIDNLITSQKKALQTPVEQAKLYKMLDMVFDMNLKFGECSCEQDEESNSSGNEESINKNEQPVNCECPDLPKKRCVLRLIRNDVYQRMKLVKKLNFLLMEKNQKIDKIIKKRERNDPNSPFVTKSVGYDEAMHKLIERNQLLKKMKEEDLPKACLFDKTELMEQIGHHRILTKPLRHIYFLEELAGKIKKKIESCNNDLADSSELDESAEKNECNCPEIKKKIEFIKNFKTMIARLNPILHREEQMLDFTKSEGKTLEQLIRDKKKEERHKLADLVHKRKDIVQILIDQHILLEEERILTDVILMLNAYIKQIEVELESYEKSEFNEAVTEMPDRNMESNEVVIKLIDEKKDLIELSGLLNKYKNRNNEPPGDEKSLLEEINGKLQNYLDQQKKYFDAMEKLIPGFKIAIFDHKLQKDRIVAEICRDEEEKKYESKVAGKSEPDGRERLRTLIKGLHKPHLHIVGSPLGRNETRKPSVGNRNEMSRSSADNNVETSSQSFGNNKKNLINKLQKFKKNIDGKLNSEVEICQYEILEKEILKEIEDLDPPLPKDKGEEQDPPQANCYSSEQVRTILKNMAFEEGRNIVSHPDPIIQRKENVIHRKMLVQELGLKCKKGGRCCTEKPGMSRLKLKAVYENKNVKECMCTNRLKQLARLENEFENIILQPEKHHIEFVSGPTSFINTNAIKRMRNFIYKHATKKVVHTDSDSNFISSLSKRKLTTEYNESRYSVVWKDFKRSGLFHINLEAQRMTNERIIIRPQYKKRVKVLSGGRIGLDPLYGEYVCTGMLDGAVLGNERNGPIPRTILQALKELDSGEGVVIIILNESEERLSFLFAIERARKLGISAELVLARDDISHHQPEKWRYGSRGHIGIVLQFKIAAGMAAKGHNLAEIARVTQAIQIATLDCYLTKYGPFIGSGIRNEKGYYIPGLQAEDVLSELLRQLIDPAGHHAIVPEPDTKMIILINKFRLRSDEIYSIISFLSKRILETGAKVGRIYHGNFSAFTRQGFSITVAKDWNDELLQFLDYPTTCVQWPPHLSGSRNVILTRTRLYRPHIIGAQVPPENVGIVFEVLDRTLREIAFSLDKILDSYKVIGDVLLKVVWILKPNLKRLPLDRPYLFLCLVGKVLNVNVPGVGKYFQLILVAAAQEFMQDPDLVVSWMNWCKALLKGIQTLAGYTKFKVGEGTMIDYLMPIADSIAGIKEGWSPLPFLFEGIEKVNNIEVKRKDDLGIILLGQLFRNMYLCLNECVGHYPGKTWWKLRLSPQILLVNQSCEDEICSDAIPENIQKQIEEKEKKWLEHSTPGSSVYSLEASKNTEPSIEVLSLEELESDSECIKSATGVLYDQQHEEFPEDFYSISEESSSWKYL
ncbi:unnamed protein product [Nezara viridula]|uniref:DhaK domain-containing protein n=1 Tax=Nezara viridula TaxID=85310 RepID=A0A9P0H957_NEZVI|nr:unnamed protein product [Nezara viridula]